MKKTTVEKPLITIIVPVYNAASTIADCITALLALNYPEEKREIIVVDNNSSDSTEKIIRRFPVQYLKEDTVQSSYAARNKGLQCSSGEIIAFTDSDCIPDSEWLAEGVRGFDEESVGAVAGKIVGATPTTIVEEFLLISNYLGEQTCLQHPFLPYIQTANAFYRRNVLDQIGLFNATFVSGGDADLSWRMQLQTRYSLKHNQNAVVIHKHRATAINFYRQMYTHGIGKADLEKLYSREMRQKGIRLESSMPFLLLFARVSFSFLCHSIKFTFLLFTLRWKQSFFEMIHWYGKTGKRFGFRKRKVQL